MDRSPFSRVYGKSASNYTVMLVFRTGEADEGVRVKLDLISVFIVTVTELLIV